MRDISRVDGEPCAQAHRRRRRDPAAAPAGSSAVLLRLVGRALRPRPRGRPGRQEAVVIATGVRGDGRHEVLGVDTGNSANGKGCTSSPQPCGRPHTALGWRTSAEALEQLLRAAEQTGVATTVEPKQFTWRMFTPSWSELARSPPQHERPVTRLHETHGTTEAFTSPGRLTRRLGPGWPGFPPGAAREAASYRTCRPTSSGPLR